VGFVAQRVRACESFAPIRSSLESGSSGSGSHDSQLPSVHVPASCPHAYLSRIESSRANGEQWQRGMGGAEARRQRRGERAAPFSSFRGSRSPESGPNTKGTAPHRSHCRRDCRWHPPMRGCIGHGGTAAAASGLGPQLCPAVLAPAQIPFERSECPGQGAATPI
jgi:hypothetical protein